MTTENRAARRRRVAENLKRRLPSPSRVVQLAEEFEGWWIKVRTNPPAGKWITLLEGVSKLDDAESGPKAEGLKSLIEAIDFLTLEWNWVDEEGDDVPVGNASLFPFRLLGHTWSRIMEESQAPLETSNS